MILGAAVRQGVERRETLEHAHRFVGAEDGDGRPEEDPLGADGNRGQDDFRGGNREVRAVVFADAERVEADLIRDHRFFDDVAQHLRLRQRLAVGRQGDVAEGVHAELERLCHQSSLQLPCRRPGAPLWLRYCFVTFNDDTQSLKLLSQGPGSTARSGASAVTVTLRPWNSLS